MELKEFITNEMNINPMAYDVVENAQTRAKEYLKLVEENAEYN